MRCFIAIGVPENIKKKVSLVQKELSKLPMVCKLVEPENIHITLSFLGELDEEKVKETSNILDSICNRYKKFEISMQPIKMIPSPSYIRVLAFEVVSARDEINCLSDDIKKLIGGKVNPPHLTVCRIKRIGNKPDVVSGIRNLESAIVGRFVVDSVDLMKSELKKTGPAYIKLHESRLVD